MRIAKGSREKLILGNTKITRDWGWAPEYVEAMHRMLCADRPDDYVIATGRSASLETFVELAFAEVGLEWRSHVEIRRELFRPLDLAQSDANPAKAAEKLGWKARCGLEDVVKFMVAGTL